jgi:hypothetical protein
MTKLYHNGEPEGWQIPGAQDRKAERIDVPNPPAELAAWLNERDVSPRVPAPNSTHAGEFDDAPSVAELLDAADRAERERGPKVPGKCDACGRSAAGALKLARGNDLDALAEWLEGIDIDELWVMQRAGELFRDHARELGLDWEARTVQ